jgi:hypothetical protein
MIVTMADNNTAAVSTATNNTKNHQPACMGKQFSIMVDNPKKEAAMKKTKSATKFCSSYGGSSLSMEEQRDIDNSAAVTRENKSANKKFKNNKNKRKLWDTPAASRDGSKNGKKKNVNRPGEGKTEYKILPPKVLSVMKKNIEMTDENSDTVTKELKGVTKKVVENKEYLVERPEELDKIMEVDCLDGGDLTSWNFSCHVYPHPFLVK